MTHQIVAASEGDDDLAELMGYDKWPEDVAIAFDRERGIVALKYLKNRKNRTFDFASVVADFRALESEYLIRLRENEENTQQVRRIITEMLLQMARDLHEPFETCQQLWNDLVQLGFYRIERRCNETWLFADICREHGQTDLGFAVLDPLVLELERLRAKPTVAQIAAKYYDQELGHLRKLRARLEAERA